MKKLQRIRRRGLSWEVDLELKVRVSYHKKTRFLLIMVSPPAVVKPCLDDEAVNSIIRILILKPYKRLGNVLV